MSATATMLTYSDISTRTGITVDTLRGRLRDGGMPKPTDRFGNVPVWDSAVIEEWAPGGVAPDRRQKTSKRVITVDAA